MKKYSVKIEVDFVQYVMVEAENKVDAVHAACDVVLSEHGRVINTNLAKSDVVESRIDVRVETYSCHYCRVSSPKRHWGVGRITCPRCGKNAPSASEPTS